VAPEFSSSANNKVGPKDGNNNYSISYVGTLAFQFQSDYDFVPSSSGITAHKGDILRFTFGIPNAKFYLGCIQAADDNT
jgi:hypothetical protein